MRTENNKCTNETVSTSNNNDGVNNALIVDTDNMHHNDNIDYEMKSIENTTDDETDSEENTDEENNENDNTVIHGANNEEYEFEPQNDTQDEEDGNEEDNEGSDESEEDETEELERDLDEEFRVESTIFIIFAGWFGFAVGTLIGYTINHMKI